MAGYTANQPFARNRTTWIAYILLAIYAYFLNILGPITPYLQDELSLSYTLSGLHFSAFAVGILVVGLAGNLLIRRTGRQLALSIGAIGVGGSALLLTVGRSPIVTIGAAFLMGCVGSLILAVVPALLADEHGEMRSVAITEANVLSSLVSASAALFVGWFANLGIGWRMALIFMALVAIGMGVSTLQPTRDRVKNALNHHSQGRLPMVFWLFWIALVLAVSIEFCMVFWSADFLESELGLPRSIAVQSVSIFLAGMLVGRLGSSWFLRYMPAQRVVQGSIGLGLVSFLLYWRTENAILGLVGLALCGLFVACLYPLLLSVALGSAGGNTVQAGARATLASGTAILALPLILGGVADSIGLRGAFSVVAALFIALFLLMLVAMRLPSEPDTPTAHDSPSQL